MDYEILSGDTVCAVYENEKLKIVNRQFAPLYFRDFRGWVESRAISDRRGYVARILKSTSGIPMYAGAYETSLAANCACITDNYWVREREVEEQ